MNYDEPQSNDLRDDEFSRNELDASLSPTDEAFSLPRADAASLQEERDVDPLPPLSDNGHRLPRRPRYHGAMISVGIILLFLYALGSLSQFGRRRNMAPIGEEIELPPAEVWRSDAPPVGPEVQQAVEDLFHRIAEALEQSDMQTFGACFDYPRLHREALRRGADEHIDARNDPRVVSIMQDRLPAELSKAWTAESFKNCQVKRCVGSVGGSEICVYVAHEDEVVGREKIRWWLARSGGQWKVYDFEDLNFGIRLSVEFADAYKLAARRAAAGEDIQGLKVSTQRLQEAQLAIQGDDYATCEHKLQQIQIDELTDGMKFMYLMMRAGIAVDQARPKQALDLLGQAEPYGDDAPSIKLFRAMAQNELGEFGMARSAARAYLDLVGDDAEGFHELARAYIGLREPQKAVEALRDALDDDPNYVDSLYLLGLSLEADEIGEVRRRFNAMAKPDEWIACLCENFFSEERGDVFQTVFNAYHKNASDCAESRYYQALLGEDWSEMVRLYEDEIDEVAALDPTVTYRPTLALAYARLGRSMDALERFQPVEEVYFQLASVAADDEDVRLLEKLNRRYSHIKGEDPRLSLWQAELHWLKDEYEPVVTILSLNRQCIVDATDAEPHVVDRTIRSLINLQRWDEASVEATVWHQTSQDPWYPALVCAARGDVDQTLEWLQKCEECGYTPFFFYFDPILAPALRKDEFKKVRVKYPDPQEPEVSSDPVVTQRSWRHSVQAVA